VCVHTIIVVYVIIINIQSCIGVVFFFFFMSSMVLSPRGNGKGKRTNPQRQTICTTENVRAVDRCHIIICGRTECTYYILLLYFFFLTYDDIICIIIPEVYYYYCIRFILGSVPIYCCCDMKRVCYVIGKQNIDGSDDLWPR